VENRNIVKNHSRKTKPRKKDNLIIDWIMVVLVGELLSI
jgi:hypothetical protein